MLAIAHLAKEFETFEVSFSLDRKLYNNGQGYYYFKPVFVLDGNVFRAVIEFDGTVNYSLNGENQEFEKSQFDEFSEIIDDYLTAFMMILDALASKLLENGEPSK